MDTSDIDASRDGGRGSLCASLGALACGLAFLALGWVWAYWIALIGAAFGAAGFALLARIGRRERARGVALTGGQRALRAAAAWTLWLATLVSAVALAATLAAN